MSFPVSLIWTDAIGLNSTVDEAVQQRLGGFNLLFKEKSFIFPQIAKNDA